MALNKFVKHEIILNIAIYLLLWMKQIEPTNLKLNCPQQKFVNIQYVLHAIRLEPSYVPKNDALLSLSTKLT